MTTWAVAVAAAAALNWVRPGPLVRLGWATTRVPNPNRDGSRGTAFLLRGQGAVFSPGFGTLCRTLREANVWAEDLRCVGDGWAYRELVERRKRGEPAGPVVLVGHSRGGRRAILAARRLEQLGIPVALLVCLDVAFPPPVPANVRRAVHVYRSRYRLYPARPLESVPGSGTAVVNVDLDAADAPVSAGPLPHAVFAAHPAVRGWIAEQILVACPARDG